jgi:hypothetical protein
MNTTTTLLHSATGPGPSATSRDEDESYELLGRLRLANRLDRRAEVPRLGDDALHGLAGDIVRAVGPITEASAPAMLATLLVTFGAMAGRGSWVYVGPKKHHPLLFAVVIGQSARARKGTSAAAVRPVIDAADDQSAPFMRDRQVRGGIQSGEALIQAVVGAAKDAATSLDETDQRLLLVEEEYVRLLIVAGRQGSTLSPTLRSAWDSDILTARTKAQSLTAEHPHVAVLGQVTIAEMMEVLKPVDVANGYANRFLHVLSSRTGLLPEPGRLPTDIVDALGARLRQAIEFAHTAGEVTRSADFTAEWDRLYRVVESQPSGGMVYDALTARASAYHLRLALVYALLDLSPTLEVQHLRAAAALWDYSEATVAHIWGATLGHANLDRLYAAVAAAGSTGMSRTEVSKVFSNNLTKEQVDNMISHLVDTGLVVEHLEKTGGRPRHMLVVAG